MTNNLNNGITMIACVDMNMGIGDKDGNLLYNLPKDMEFFKSKTEGHIVVMGRKTWDSLKVKPLKGRKNYVLTNDSKAEFKGAKKSSFEEIIELSKNYEVMIIGGGEIYEMFMPYADKLILTHIYDINTEATSFFPNFSHDDFGIKDVKIFKSQNENELGFSFVEYYKK